MRKLIKLESLSDPSQDSDIIVALGHLVFSISFLMQTTIYYTPAISNFFGNNNIVFLGMFTINMYLFLFHIYNASNRNIVRKIQAYFLSLIVGLIMFSFVIVNVGNGIMAIITMFGIIGIYIPVRKIREYVYKLHVLSKVREINND
jgi:hypothetical protein